VKGWGKSPPRRRQRRRHGKPRLEQDQIGTSRGFARGVHRLRCPGRSREPISNGRSRGMIVAAFRSGTKPGLQAVWHIFSTGCAVRGVRAPLPRAGGAGRGLIHRPALSFAVFYNRTRSNRHGVHRAMILLFFRGLRTGQILSPGLPIGARLHRLQLVNLLSHQQD
jgi:hypothetical protein